MLKKGASVPLSKLFILPTPGPNATCPLLMLDHNRGEPRNFRSPRWFKPADGCLTDMTGFDLPISANAQCGTKGWSEVMKKIRTVHDGLVINLSLRQESYAYIKLNCSPEEFSNAAPEEVEYSPDFLPVSWFTKNGNWSRIGLTDADAGHWNDLLVGTLMRQDLVSVVWPVSSNRPSYTFRLAQACTPREMAKEHGMKFRRLFIADHCGPRLESS